MIRSVLLASTVFVFFSGANQATQLKDRTPGKKDISVEQAKEIIRANYDTVRANTDSILNGVSEVQVVKPVVSTDTYAQWLNRLINRKNEAVQYFRKAPQSSVAVRPDREHHNVPDVVIIERQVPVAELPPKKPNLWKRIGKFFKKVFN